MPQRRVKVETGIEAVRAVLANSEKRNLTDQDFVTAVRYLAEELSVLRPGKTVELRVPPLVAVQCIAGMEHRRGTPPNVVELAPEDWFNLAVGLSTWTELKTMGRIRASGVASDIGGAFPIWR